MKYTDNKHRERYKDSDGRWKTAPLRDEPFYSLPRYPTKEERAKEIKALRDFIEKSEKNPPRRGAYERWLEEREQQREQRRNRSTND